MFIFKKNEEFILSFKGIINNLTNTMLIYYAKVINSTTLSTKLNIHLSLQLSRNYDPSILLDLFFQYSPIYLMLLQNWASLMLFTLSAVPVQSPLFYLSSKTYLKYVFQRFLKQLTSGIVAWGTLWTFVPMKQLYLVKLDK